MIKKNKLLVVVIVTYLLLFIFNPAKAYQAFDNSSYYLIEMLQILPIIFLLTVAIEALIPKTWIMKHFGEHSGMSGNLLSLALGSISAGPIYAAFPVSKMLLSKGASIPNIVIILSSWAVIKVPMLANEAKFLGLPFMVTRWVLTVVTIFIMAWLMGKVVKKSDMKPISVTDHENLLVIEINHDYCIGCGICSRLAPELFEITNKKAFVKVQPSHTKQKADTIQSIEQCPTQAIIMLNKA